MIAVSESLHYPDFTCVVLYRRLVIGFALMLPNATVSEAYISFLFVHPDWRRAGIAKFMLYHLVQVRFFIMCFYRHETELTLLRCILH
jgi:GNAT superfamily N-acetyltransferase